MGVNIDSRSAAVLQTVAEREAALLAPWAMHSGDTQGRKIDEPAHPYRGPFQRDRDRIIHCSAFRRLSGKMQVFTGEMGDYHRTRLTHTQEVASIARTIGRALRLNEDLVEALALLHDIGHPPYGHAGEDALNTCMAEVGGFSHNQHALTIVEELESRGGEAPGLNLSLEVLTSQAARIDKSIENHTGEAPLLEAQVVEAADSVTYDAHDVDDAVELGLLTLDALRETALVDAAVENVRRRHGALSEEALRKAVVHDLIDIQVSDLLDSAGALLTEARFPSASAARGVGVIIEPSAELAARKKELEDFLHERVYRHPRLMEMRCQAQERLRLMFEGYVSTPGLLTARFIERAELVGLRRSVGDYLAEMTDRYCDRQFREHFYEQ